MSESKSKTETPAWARALVDDKGLASIREAVRKVESRTSAEIVPMVVSGSSTTGHVSWILFLGLLLLAWTLGPRLLFFAAPGAPEWAVELAALTFALVLSWGLNRSPRVHRWLTPRIDQLLNVERRALVEFHLAHIEATENRTGILLMASLLERRAIVIADQAISARLPRSTWNDVIAVLIAKTREGLFADGMVAAIEALGQHLEPHFPAKAEKKDELDDGLIIKI